MPRKNSQEKKATVEAIEFFRELKARPTANPKIQHHVDAALETLMEELFMLSAMEMGKNP